MKKILFAIFALAALALTSCEAKLNIMDIDVNKLDNTEFKCWKYTVKHSRFCDGTIYVWDTEYNLVVVLQAIYKTSGNKAVITYGPTPDDDKNGFESKNDF